MTTGTPLQVEPQPVAVYGRETEVRAVLPSNTPVPAVGAFPKKVTEVRALVWNAKEPMLVTELPIVTVVRALLRNAEAPMVVTEFGIVTVVRALLLNAPAPMLVTELPIVTVVRALL
jgi:hypothetical protein